MSQLIKSFDLSTTQKAMLYDSYMTDPIAYNLSACVHFENVDEKIFEESFNILIAEQEVLRCKVEVIDDSHRLVICETISNPLEKIDFCDPLQDQGKRVADLIEKEISEPFNLENSPLFRAKLLKLSEKEHVFVFCIHHIIFDGLSMNILLKKLVNYHDKLSQKSTIQVVVNSEFSKFVESENEKYSKGVSENKKILWNEKIKDGVPARLPKDFSVDCKGGFAKEIRFRIPREVSQCIEQRCTEYEVTTFAFYFSVFSILMRRFSSSDKLLLITPFSYRSSVELENTLGCFIQMLLLPVVIKNQNVFSEVLQAVGAGLINSYINSSYSPNLIVSDNVGLNPELSSLFDVIFVLDVYEEFQCNGVKAKIVHQDVVTFPGDVMLVLNTSPEGDFLKIQYKPDVYKEETLGALGRDYLDLLKLFSENLELGLSSHSQNLSCFKENSQQKISAYPLLTDKERDRLLFEWNQTEASFPNGKTIHRIFEEQVEKTPDKIAVVFEDQQLTYRELNAKANFLAHYLRGLGVETETLVAISIERSINLIVGLLGILKAGAAYVPLDPNYPLDRLTYMLDDTKATVLITQSNFQEKLGGLRKGFEERGGKIIELDRGLSEIIRVNEENRIDVNINPQLNPETDVNARNLAYVIYTSGSTGKPKGVQIEHQGVVNLLSSLSNKLQISETDKFLQSTSVGFDIAALEIFMPLHNGNRVILLSQTFMSDHTDAIIQLVNNKEITVIQATPSRWQLLVEAGFQPHAELKMICGGEALPQSLQSILTKQNVLHHVYGPTETTIWSTHALLKNEDCCSIGSVINNTTCYILDPNLSPVAVGIIGELYIGGVGVARGYLNRPELTAERFIENPFLSEQNRAEKKAKGEVTLLYRTGDLVRYLPDKNIEYIGRIDHQVKIRGFRIECGEIETVIRQHNLIKDVVVIAQEDANSEKRLVAYIIPKLSEHENEQEQKTQKLNHLIHEIRLLVENQLPDFMMPCHFMALERFPLTPNGKLDRKALPIPTEPYRSDEQSFVAPDSELEKKIVIIWSEALKIEAKKIGLDDNFFDVGGNSFALIKANNLFKKENLSLPLKKQFELTTVRSIANYFTHLHSGEVLIQKSEDKKTSFCGIEKSTESLNRDIAIIGISSNVPGAQTVQDFWKNLKCGKQTIHFYDDAELLEMGISPETLKSPNYVKAVGRIEDIDHFDSGFFDYTPAEAKLISPQYRILHSGLWNAFEDAGYFPGSTESSIGLFLSGSDDFDWYQDFITNENDFSLKYQGFTLSTNHFLATRLAYKFNLKGPVFTSLSGCSSSLLTVHLACQSLILKECDIAVAGGVTISLPNKGGYFYKPGLMFSPDGYCRPFDAKAAGTFFSNGMGLVVLKRLKDAQQDGDHIYAVIKGSAINNDGSQKLGFTAPSVQGQAECVQKAYQVAGINPETVSYVEAHGTGTIMGDPIEVESLTQAFDTDKKQFCVLSSVKGNIGHADTAAGVVSLAKVALSLKHKFIPGTANYQALNPKINLDSSPFVIRSEGMEWKRENAEVLRAGINSFGVGGTNVHMVLEEAPLSEKSSPPTAINLLVFSAKSPAALISTSEKIIEFIFENPGINVSDVSWTLQVGRKEFAYRKYLIVDNAFFQHDKEVVLTCLNSAKIYKTDVIKSRSNDPILQELLEKISSKEACSLKEMRHLYHELGKFWATGNEVNWEKLKQDSRRLRISLPTYEFDPIPYPIRVKLNGEETSKQEKEENNIILSDRSKIQSNTKNSNDCENKVIDAYKSVLGLDVVDLEQDFFHLGGDSLKAINLISVINTKFGLSIDIKELFDYSTPASLAEFIRNKSSQGPSNSTITALEEKEFYPLSSAQNRMYTLYMLDKKNIAYNLSSATWIKGSLNKEKFEKTLRKLVARHEPLRTRFEIRENKPVQVIDKSFDLPLNYSEETVRGDDDIHRVVHDFIRPFDLENELPFRAELIKTEENTYLFLVDVHHIVADATSMEIIADDFNSLYVRDLVPLAVQYKDFADWEIKSLNSDSIQKQEEFWVNYLSGELPKLNVPLDFERKALRSYQGDRIYFTFDEALSEKIIRLGKKNGTTLFMTLLAAWSVLLARYSGQEDFILGVSVAGRTLSDVREMVGMFVNMLPIKNSVSPEKRFCDLMKQVKENVLDAFQNQDYPFNALVQKLNLNRDMSRNILFDVCFDFQNIDFNDLSVENIQFIHQPFKTRCSTYDLLLTCQQDKDNGHIKGFMDYSTSLFKKERIESLIEDFRALLVYVVENETETVENMEILSQKQADFQSQCDGQEVKLIGKNVQEIFEASVRKFSNEIAIITADQETLNYDELNRKSNALAWSLLNSGVEKGELVPILVGRDQYILISMLAVIKAGAAFVLIDPLLPIERISHIHTECRARFLLSTTEHAHKINNPKSLIILDDFDYTANTENPTSRTDLKDLAYVMFTSGTTGSPKGVMINQEAVINFISDVNSRRFYQNTKDRIISLTTVSFDIYIFESLVPLCLGGSIYIANEREQLDPHLASEKIVQNQVTHILSTISRIKSFVENPGFSKALTHLRYIFTGGENFPLALLSHLKAVSSAKIYNMYGPTETTVWSTTKDLTNENQITIGKPIANTKIYITDPEGKLQPLNVYGELYIGGKGIAQGYLNNAEETRRKFIFLENGEQVYKTGDRGRILPNGDLELSGRLDTQVKIRGYRIELEEIEKKVLEYDAIGLVALTAYEDDNNTKQLALYFSLKHGVNNFNLSDFKHWLKSQLPHYMIPTCFNHLVEMPVLPSGKVNKKDLPTPGALNITAEKKECSNLSKSDLKSTLLKFWREALCIEQINLDDNFFDLGGNSLRLIELNNKLSKELGYSIPLLQLFQFPTINSFVKNISEFQVDFQEPINVIQEAPVFRKEDIAVIGMAGKFPQAQDLEEFWSNLMVGRESISQFTDKELTENGVAPEIFSKPEYKNVKGFLENVEYFDAEFFAYSSKEADIMDPQSRVLHQCAWELLENAGYDPSRYDGRIGFYAGSASNFMWIKDLLNDPEDVLQAYDALTFNEKDFLTTRLSYKLNLKGPSYNIQTACSTSLVAIHQAVQSLNSGECEMAMAGGVALSFPRKEGYLWHEGMIFSRDGHCKPFSSDATGIVPGDGCGLVLLKPLEAAIRDKDHIYAVIKGSAINNDGNEKVGYTAPSISAQKIVIEKALEKSSVSADQINYLEAHGTGTAIGDPIEIEALKQAWNTNKKNYCALGSVKANIGHLDTAAGVASFIKAALMLEKREFPPLINYEKENPLINIKESPFYINKQGDKNLDPNLILRAGVSSFGIGGTNAHLILEQAPQVLDLAVNYEIEILPFSARNLEALENTGKKLFDYLQNHPEISLSDAAWTLQIGRKAFDYRKSLVIKNRQPRFEDINIEAFLNSKSGTILEKNPNIILILSSEDLLLKEIFSGIYNQASKSKLTRYFKNSVDATLTKFPGEEKSRLISILQGESVSANYCEEKASAMFLFMVNFTFGKMLIDLGIIPAAIIGQGIGEVAALVLSESLTFDEAIRFLNENYEKLASFKPGELATRIFEKDSHVRGLSNISSQYVFRSPKIHLISNSQDPILFNEKALKIEVGPGQIILDSLENTDRKRSFQLLALTKEPEKPVIHLNKVVGEIWCAGVNIHWEKMNVDTLPKRVPLPSYAFMQEYHKDSINPITTGSIHVSPAAIEKPNVHENFRTGFLEIWMNLFGGSCPSPDDDFFKKGGDSLKAVILAANIEKTLGIKISVNDIFNNSQFSKMEDYLLSRSSVSEPEKIIAKTKSEFYPTSFAQKRMYAVHEFLGDSLPYNLSAVYICEGKVDKNKIKEVFDILVKRHSAFRTEFKIIDGELVQRIRSDIESVFEFEDCQEEIVDKKIQEFMRPFNLSQAPLIRIKLMSINLEKHIFMIDLHHIISDQASIGILLSEFESLYIGKTLTSVSAEYYEYAGIQNTRLKDDICSRQKDYWLKEFCEPPSPLSLPLDFPRSEIRAFSGDRVSLKLESVLSKKINSLAKENACTPYMIFMAALKLVLWKYTDQEDVVVGTATAGRSDPEYFNVIGMFVNTLAIRSVLNGSWSTREYLHTIRAKMLGAFENQDYPLELLIQDLGQGKDLSRNPLFDVVINYIDMGNQKFSIDGLSMKPHQNVPVYSKFDLTWTIEKCSEDFYADLEFDSALFKKETIELIVDRLSKSLEFIVDNINENISKFSFLSNKERDHLLYELNRTERQYPKDKTIPSLLEEQVALHGDKTALIWNDEQMSYLEFNKLADKVAMTLRRKGIEPGDRIALRLERSPLQMVSIFGILKLGCTYVPIDTQFPESRVEFILEDSSAKALITTSKFKQEKWNNRYLQVFLDTDPDFLYVDIENNDFRKSASRCRSEDAAYIMYTSGSTGKPKGVITTHRNIISTVRNTNFIEFLPSDCLLQLSNVSFDGSTFDIFGSLLNGASLVLTDDNSLRDMSLLSKLIQKQNISVLFITTSLFNALVDWDLASLKNLRKIAFGGEAASVSHVRKALNFLGPDKLINGYGPTETTVFCTYYHANSVEELTECVPIGYPLTNKQAYILDKQGQPVPDDIPGELCIGGDGIANGYLNRPELNCEKFLDSPFRPGEKMYRTGDRVKRLKSGVIIYLGRFDFMVKIRGYRIELGEIEESMKCLEGIKEAVVHARKDAYGNDYIGAYYTVDNEVLGNEIEVKKIQEFLKSKIPVFMIPSRFKCLDKIPLNLNGKVDFSSLPSFEEEVKEKRPSKEVLSFTERQMLKVMSQVLDNKNLAVDDDFFESGGHSIKAIAFTMEILKYGISIKVNDIYQNPTVKKLSKMYISRSEKKKEIVGDLHNGNCLEDHNSECVLDKIKEIPSNLLSQWDSFSQIILTTKVLNRFSLAGIQKFHLKYPRRISGFTMELLANISETTLMSAIVKMVIDNQLLHSIIQREPDLEWVEYELANVLDRLVGHIPFLDISVYDSQVREEILSDIYKSIVSKQYQEAELPWRICCLRIAGGKYRVIWGFDHIAFDGMSADVIRAQLEAIVFNSLPGKEPSKYADYVALLKSGPQNVSEDDIMQKFSLQKWCFINKSLSEELLKSPDPEYNNFELKFNLLKYKIQDPWNFSFNFVVDVLKDFYQSQVLPLAFINYARSYCGTDFYNSIGEFLDIIPVYVDKKEFSILSLLQLARSCGINFASLVFDPILSVKYSNIARCLAPFYREDGSNLVLPLFNFQGFISDENRKRYRSLGLVSSENCFSKFLINVNYDEQNLYIHFLFESGEIVRLEDVAELYVKNKLIAKEKCYA